MIKPDAMARRVMASMGGWADPETVARAHGIDVARVDMHGPAAGLLLDDGGWVILINRRQNLYTGRERFTIAHELGHYFCHRHLRRCFVCLADDPRPAALERQANAFAAELLMPRPHAHRVIQGVLAAGGRVADAVETLAATFAVSREAAEIRLEELGYRLAG